MRNTEHPSSSTSEAESLLWAVHSAMEGLGEVDQRAVTALRALTEDDVFRIATSALRARERCGLGVGTAPSRLAALERVANDFASVFVGRPLPADPAMAEEMLGQLQSLVDTGLGSFTDETCLNVHFTHQYSLARWKDVQRPGQFLKMCMPKFRVPRGG